MEPIYYATQDTRGGLIVKNDMCDVCYEPDNLVAKQELLESVLKKGGEPFPICRECYDSGTKLEFLAKANIFKSKGQEDKLNKDKKRKTLEEARKINAKIS